MADSSRRRPRAQALPASDGQMRWWLTGLIGLGFACAATLACAQQAENTTSAPAATTDGVIAPPVIDPAIHAKPPVDPSALSTPVIPPPGTQGGDTKIVPK